MNYNPSGIRKLKSNYGISLAEYSELWDKQGGLCAICKKPETAISRNGQVRSLAVDHNHETNEIRGLTCCNCNAGAGYFSESPEKLRLAAAYLRRFK